MNQRLYSQKTPHISPWRASYGVSTVGILGRIYCIIMALHCIWENDDGIFHPFIHSIRRSLAQFHHSWYKNGFKSSISLISFLFHCRGLKKDQVVLLTHGDSISKVAKDFKVVAQSGDIVAGGNQYPSCHELIATKFCTWLNSCAKFACDVFELGRGGDHRLFHMVMILVCKLTFWLSFYVMYLG